MDNLDFCKEHYFFEINRKHQLTSSLALPVGLLTVIGGVVVYYLKYISVSSDIISNIYNILLMVTLFFVGRTVYYLIRSYHNYTYSYIATPDELLDYHQELLNYHNNNCNKADEIFCKYLQNQYSKKASKNTWNNDSKSEFLHKANSNLIYSLIILLMCSIPYFYITNGNTKSVQQVELVGFEKLLHKRVTTVTRPTPTPPPPPPGRDIKEGVQPPRPTPSAPPTNQPQERQR